MWQLLPSLCLLLLACSCLRHSHAQPLSRPVPSSEHLPSSNYTRNAALVLEDVLFGTDISHLSTSSSSPPACAALNSLRLDLAWQHHADSGVYATGVITPSLLHSHDRQHTSDKLLILPGFQHHLNVLDHDGHHVGPSPLTLTSSTASFHSSPVLYDYNRDGWLDVLWLNVDAQLLIVNGRLGAQPLLLAPLTRLPKLRVHRRWYEGLNVTIPATMHRQPRTAVFEDEDEPDASNRQQQQQQQQQQGLGRRLLAVEDDDTFAHMLDNLPEEARANLLLFSSSPDSSLIQLDEHNEVEYPQDEAHVWLDAHVLATPTLTDFNLDGERDELVISVSYFFDEEQYNAEPHLYAHLPADIDLHMYVSGGVQVLHLPTLSTTMSAQLDLTTDYTELKALIYSQPTVVDLDGDGDEEVVVATSLGMVYVLSKEGAVRDGWPVVMGEVQAQVVVEDVNGDGRLELIVGDAQGNVVCLDSSGKEVWHTQVVGFPSQAVSIADIDLDGTLDVVFGTVSGQLWALRGNNGSVLPRFPYKTNGKIIAPVTILTPHYALPLLVFPSFDGRVYVADARGCMTSVDIGEHAYAMVLADSILGTEWMDLLVATMSGNMYLLHTDIRYHPLLAKTDHSQTVDRHGYHGVYWSWQTRHQEQLRGRHFTLYFVITDHRAKTKQQLAPRLSKQAAGMLFNDSSAADAAQLGAVVTPRYNVSILLDGRVVYNHWLSRPGEYRVSVAASGEAKACMLTVRVVNEHRQVYEDSVRVVVNMYWYRVIKWLVLLPFLVMGVLLLAIKPVHLSLPT